MIYTTDEIQRRIMPVAEKYQLNAVHLFGSYARNEAGDDSDVDILVDLKGSSVKGWIIGALYNDLCESLEKRIDMITNDTLEQESTKQRTPWFINDVLMETVKIYGKD